MIPADLVVLIDVDNTLLDNDAVRDCLERELAESLGEGEAACFWRIYEEVRESEDHVDFPATVERFGAECDAAALMGKVSATLYDFPFHLCLFPDSLEVIQHVASFAMPAILSDGDQLFQRYKIRSSGLEAAVDGRVLVYVHKEQRIADIKQRFPAKHYASVDDKPRILAAMKAEMGDELTTILVCQGKYAHDLGEEEYPAPDITIDVIGDLLSLSPEDFRRPPA